MRKKQLTLSAILSALLLVIAQILWQQIGVSEYGDNTSESATTASSQSVPEENTVGERATVSRVVDGDTVKVLVNGEEETLRMIGVNTPETVDPRRTVECFGKEASNAMKNRLTEGAEVTLIADQTQDNEDKYGRLLRYIEDADGQDVGLWLIAQGYAHEYTYRVPYERQEAYQEAQRKASESQKGLWDVTICP